MKKFLLLVTLFGSTNLLKAQSLELIKISLLQKKVDDAKSAIDKLMLDPKQAAKSDVVFLKGKVYTDYSKGPKLSFAEAYSNRIIAFEAFKSYLQMDKKATLMTEEGNFPFLLIYADFVDLGGDMFNKTNYPDAFTSYVKAQEVEDFIFEKGYTYTQLKLNKLDTGLILNTAAIAVKLKDSVTAVKYYTKLIDAGVNDANSEAVYDFVVRYYMDKGDVANFKTNLSKAQKIYTTNAYWTNLELEFLRINDKPAMFALYDENFIKNPSNKENTINYGIELYYLYYDNVKGKKDSASSAKLISVLKAAVINGDETNKSNVLLANHLNRIAVEYLDKAALIKSLKPADVKRKKDLTSLSTATYDELIPYAESCIKIYKNNTTITKTEKSYYKAAASYLVDAYNAVKNVAKASEYEKLLNSISDK